MYQFIFSIIDKGYQHIFGYSMGGRAQRFFENIFLVSFGVIPASAISVGFTILAARLLGPGEFGKASLVFSIAGFLAVPMGFGLTAAITRYAASNSERREIISSGFYLTILFTVFFSTLFYILRTPLAVFLRIPVSFFDLSLLVAASLTLFNLSHSILKGVHRFGVLAASHIGAAVIFASLIIFLIIVRGERGFDSLVISTLFRFLGASIIGFFLIRQYLQGMKQAAKWFPTLINYGGIAFFSTIPTSFWGVIDRLALHTFVGLEAVGIYSAYFASSQMIIGRLLEIVLAVFFPSVSTISSESKKEIFKKLIRAGAFLSLPFFIILSLIIFLLMLFFGRDYLLDPFLVALFSLGAWFFLLVNLLGWLIASGGTTDFRYVSLHVWMSVIVNSIAALILVPNIGLYGAILSFLLTMIYLFFAFIYYFSRST